MLSHPDRRTPVVLLAGFQGPVADGMDHLARLLGAAPGTVVVRHDLSSLPEGVVRRRVHLDGRETASAHELAHGCVSCTLRADLLPLLCRLAARDSVHRIVIALDPAFEAEAVCHAIGNVPVVDLVGRVDGPAARDVRIEAVVTGLDARSWLPDALSDETIDERAGGPGDDDRTVAQLAVGQVEFADALVVFGTDQVGDGERDVLRAVVDRLVPRAPSIWVGDGRDIAAARIEMLLDRIPADSRRGRIFDAHAPLLRGRPPLTEENGVALIEFATDRPFHPTRLHEAMDVLFDGVVTARGRIWLATQPERVVWLESAGGGVRVGDAGTWLAAMSPTERDSVDPDRRALAALRWDEDFGDRDISLVVLTCGANPDDIRTALHWALLDEAEMILLRNAPDLVAHWDDPFGEFHEDPCDTTESDNSGGRGVESRPNER
ncbi:ribosome hibernation factor-recruiting GTPase MRF [Nocardia aobensis]|uniref:ribosome hibernation factor-recruiting GTPase MRF n=1 Tax=Nocardia aobensis TaxID=257277 RepID=UPI0002D9955F|nr:GTP-binding protein [Nocardia aobensis]